MAGRTNALDSTVESSTDAPRSVEEIMQALNAESENKTKETVSKATSTVRKGSQFLNKLDDLTDDVSKTGSKVGRAARYVGIYVPSRDSLERTVNTAKSLGKKYLGYNDEQIAQMDGVDAYNVVESGMASNPDGEVAESVKEKAASSLNSKVHDEPVMSNIKPFKIKTLPTRQESTSFVPNAGPSNEYMDLDMNDYLVTNENAEEVYAQNAEQKVVEDDPVNEISDKRARLNAETESLSSTIKENGEKALEDGLSFGSRFF